MARTQAADRSKRRMRAVPLLGAAGLSLSVVSGATSAIGSADLHRARTLPPSAGQPLAEEEIFEVSLATFHVGDDGTVARGVSPRPFMVSQGACGADLYYPQSSPAVGAPAYQAAPVARPRSARPAYRYRRSYSSGRP
jgi:hypothetical protein